MTGVIQEDIFRLQIAVNDVEAMKTFQGAEKLGCIEARPVDVESLLPLQVVEELSAVHECKH